MAKQPVPIGQAVDDAMREKLGDDGFDNYTMILFEQTQQARDRIIGDVRSGFETVLAGEIGRMIEAHPYRCSPLLAVDARMRAEAAVTAEIGRLVSLKEQRFRAACDSLYAWFEGQREARQ